MEIKALLLIDDSETIRLIVKTGLQRHFKIWLAASGAEGVALAQSNQPDVILLDVRMSGMSGIDTLAELKSNALTADIPVIFLTGGVELEEMEAYSKLDVVGVIEKPFGHEELFERLCRLVKDL